MGTLVFACPATGEEVSTGIEMDLATLERLRLEKIYCHHCRQPHHMAAIEYWLTEMQLPDATYPEDAKSSLGSVSLR